jgi:hypothetical protein
MTSSGADERGQAVASRGDDSAPARNCFDHPRTIAATRKLCISILPKGITPGINAFLKHRIFVHWCGIAVVERHAGGRFRLTNCDASCQPALAASRLLAYEAVPPCVSLCRNEHPCRQASLVCGCRPDRSGDCDCAVAAQQNRVASIAGDDKRTLSAGGIPAKAVAWRRPRT